MTNSTPLPTETVPSSPATRTRTGTPPGAAGKRTPQERFQREAGIRRALFAGSLAAFVAIFGLVASAGKPASASNTPEPSLVRTPDADYQVVAEVPLGNVAGSGGQGTIVRIISPQPQAPIPHVRTRAS